MSIEFNNVFYFKNINSIGGVESFFYYLAKKYQDFDITIMYESANEKQLNRLKQFVRTKKYNGEKIKCQKIFVNYYSTGILDNTQAKEYIFMIHADYKRQGNLRFIQHPKINRYIAVSNEAAKSFLEVTAIEPEVFYNPIVLEKPKKILNLISATRLTPEKGRERMILLGKKLNEANIPYLWTIFTNDSRRIDNPNMIFVEPRFDITNYIANADYLVQLSDCETYCYSVVESLMLRHSCYCY